MELWPYIEQGLIALLFVWACRQLWRTLVPAAAGGGCTKGCGDACPATQLGDRLAQAEAEWERDVRG